MSISVGTIVTRYDSDKALRSCENGTCVGKVLRFEVVHTYETLFTIKWYELCEMHNHRIFCINILTLDDLWEIGQIY